MDWFHYKVSIALFHFHLDKDKLLKFHSSSSAIEVEKFTMIEKLFLFYPPPRIEIDNNSLSYI